MANDLTETRLRAALGARPFQFYEQTGSTNDLAREWVQQRAISGSVVLAEEQLAGRGRFGRAWSAPPGTALLISVIVRPQPHLTQMTRFAMLGAVAVAETLDPLAPDLVRLKWPNDVKLAGRKVTGILPEAVWAGQTLQAVILGIGLNVRVDFTGTPLADQAISLEPTIGQTVDRAALLAQLLARIDYWAVRLESDQLFQSWKSRLETLGQAVTATGDGWQISGTAVDVDADGALVIAASDGTTQRVVSGEVTMGSSPPNKNRTV